MTAAVTNPQLAQSSAGAQTVTIGSSSDFSAALLALLGVPVTDANIGALNAWQAAEGQWGASGSWNAGQNHNPLNLEGTTRGFPDTASGVQYATPSNPINIYADWTDGLEATAQRIQANPGIVNVLATGQASPALLSAAVQHSGWGTGDFSGGSTASQTGTGGSQTATLDVSLKDVEHGAQAAVLGPLGLLPDIAGGLGGSISKSFGVLSDLTSLSFWKRFAMGALGVALMILGGAVFIGSTKPGQEAASVAALAAA